MTLPKGGGCRPAAALSNDDGAISEPLLPHPMLLPLHILAKEQCGCGDDDDDDDDGNGGCIGAQLLKLHLLLVVFLLYSQLGFLFVGQTVGFSDDKFCIAEAVTIDIESFVAAVTGAVSRSAPICTKMQLKSL